MKAYIYQITNRVTDQSYIGSTSTFPTRRWAEHFAELRQGSHINSLMQDLFRLQDGDLTTWEFRIMDFIPEITSMKKLRQIEAEWILGIPKSLRLNVPNQTTTTRERYAEVERRLKEGQRYVDIRDEVGISMGMISRIKQDMMQE